jgi:hypothetical protein
VSSEGEDWVGGLKYLGVEILSGVEGTTLMIEGSHNSEGGVKILWWLKY